MSIDPQRLYSVTRSILNDIWSEAKWTENQSNRIAGDVTTPSILSTNYFITPDVLSNIMQSFERKGFIKLTEYHYPQKEAEEYKQVGDNLYSKVNRLQIDSSQVSIFYSVSNIDRLEQYLTEIKRNPLLKETTTEPGTSNKTEENTISIFDDESGVILIGKISIQLPPFKNEHYFCRSAYKYQVGQPIDWSQIYGEITGFDEIYNEKTEDIKDKWRIVYDAMDAVNHRVKSKFISDRGLFSWKAKTVRRNF